MPIRFRSWITSTPEAKIDSLPSSMSPSMLTESIKSFIRLTLRSNVDFPHPLGPTNAVTIPRAIGMLMLYRACLRP